MIRGYRKKLVRREKIRKNSGGKRDELEEGVKKVRKKESGEIITEGKRERKEKRKEREVRNN